MKGKTKKPSLKTSQQKLQVLSEQEASLIQGGVVTPVHVFSDLPPRI